MRLLTAWAFCLLAPALSACPGLPLRLPGLAASPEAPGTRASATTPVVSAEPSAPAPTPSPSPASTAGMATPVPSPSATRDPDAPFVLAVAVDPTSVTLGVRPPAGATPFMADSRKLSVQFLYNDGSRITDADWQSTDPTVAEVDATGLVSAQGKVGEVLITANSRDGLAKGEIRVTVVDRAGLGVLIE